MDYSEFKIDRELIRNGINCNSKRFKSFDKHFRRLYDNFDLHINILQWTSFSPLESLYIRKTDERLCKMLNEILDLERRRKIIIPGECIENSVKPKAV